MTVIGARKVAVWATAAAAIVSAVTLALGDGGPPRVDVPARSTAVGAVPATAAR